MTNIEIFDKYINGELSESERVTFMKRLDSDQTFATDFNIYSLSVIGICKEADQDNMDFGLAMKKLSKEQLCEIIGKKADASKNLTNKKPTNWIKPWMWQAGSIAAVIVIAFIVILNMHKHYQYALYDNIYACAQFEETHNRGVTHVIDITNLSDSELKAKLPEMEKNYNESDDPDERYLYGYPLAMAYIRLHQPKPALDILNTLVSELKNDEYYEPQVREMRLIINLIK